MQIVSVHKHNLDTSAHVVWESRVHRLSVCKVRQGFVAVHLGAGNDKIAYAEPTFKTLSEAEGAAYQIIRERNSI